MLLRRKVVRNHEFFPRQYPSRDVLLRGVYTNSGPHRDSFTTSVGLRMEILYDNKGS